MLFLKFRTNKVQKFKLKSVIVLVSILTIAGFLCPAQEPIKAENFAVYPLIYSIRTTNVTNNSAEIEITIIPAGAFTQAWVEFNSKKNSGKTPITNIPPTYSIEAIKLHVFSLLPSTKYSLTIHITNDTGYHETFHREITTLPGASLYSNNLSTPTYNPPSAPQTSPPWIKTLTPSYVSDHFAILRGKIYLKNEKTQIWFEWGDSSKLGNITSYIIKDTKSPQIAYFYLDNLQPNHLYYYRVIGKTSTTTKIGNIVKFRTKLRTEITKTYPRKKSFYLNNPSQLCQLNNQTSKNCKINFLIFPEKREIKIGENFKLFILVKNLSSQPITEIKITTIIPSSLILISSSQAIKKEGSSAIFSLSKLNPSDYHLFSLTLKPLSKTKKPAFINSFLLFKEGDKYYSIPNSSLITFYTKEEVSNLKTPTKKPSPQSASLANQISSLSKNKYFWIVLGIVSIFVIYFLIK